MKIKLFDYVMGIGDWGLGIGDWGLGPIPNPQSPIPNPQSPYSIYNYIYIIKLFNFILFNINHKWENNFKNIFYLSPSFIFFISFFPGFDSSFILFHSSINMTYISTVFSFIIIPRSTNYIFFLFFTFINFSFI